MKKLLLNIFIIFVLFQNIIFNLVPMPSIISYWDEFIELFLILYSLIYFKNNGFKKNLLPCFMILFLIVGVGLLSNLIYNYVPSFNYIFRDIVNFLKFPLTFLLLYYMDAGNIIGENISKITIMIIKIIVIIMFACGIVSLFLDIGMSQNEIRHGIKPFQFLFSHPTYVVLSNIMILSLLESFNVRNISVYRFLILIIIILTMRTKGIMIVALYIFIKYFGKNIKKFKMLYIILSVLIVFVAGYQKLALYNTYTTSPREILYTGSVEIVKNNFPFGSGFASFASHISGKSGSLVYDFVRFPQYFINTSPELTFLGDAGYAYYIGQFGLLGMVLIALLVFKLYKIIAQKNKNILPVILLFGYILIALTTESTLLNSGIELSFVAVITIFASNKYFKKAG